MPTERDVVAFIRDEDNWPVWPLLPLKRRDEKTGETVLACLIAGHVGANDTKVEVFLDVNVFTPIVDVREHVTAEYDTLGDMLADDWKVD